MHPLTQAWLINDRIGRYLVEAISEADWETKLAKGKSVAGQFAHIHSVRLMWLKVIDPSLEGSIPKLDGAGREETVAALTASGKAVADVVENALASAVRIKNFKPTTEAFVGYLISHESNHRGQAELALRQAGVPLPDKVAYGLWEWGSRGAEL